MNAQRKEDLALEPYADEPESPLHREMQNSASITMETTSGSADNMGRDSDMNNNNNNDRNVQIVLKDVSKSPTNLPKNQSPNSPKSPIVGAASVNIINNIAATNTNLSKTISENSNTNSLSRSNNSNIGGIVSNSGAGTGIKTVTSAQSSQGSRGLPTAIIIEREGSEGTYKSVDNDAGEGGGDDDDNPLKARKFLRGGPGSRGFQRLQGDDVK